MRKPVESGQPVRRLHIKLFSSKTLVRNTKGPFALQMSYEQNSSQSPCDCITIATPSAHNPFMGLLAWLTMSVLVKSSQLGIQLL